ncbi:MAG: TRAP transporter TatT component family protein [Myxococcales bacterium]|nr:TRAP transporter TatT component family protein [Myxococcales bacterium]MDH3485301.1 TRAP transporter TatT component family protein [Myxococcales bacterium]
MYEDLLSARLRWVLAGCCIVVLVAGCDLTKLTAESTAGLFERAAPGFEEYWDYELAGEAVPATIVQLEGILRVAPDNDALLTQLSQAYFGYAYGWIDVDVEALEFEGKYDEADVQRRRAGTMYLRSKDLTMHRISLLHPGVYDASKGSVEELEAWLEESFKEKGDAPLLLWAGQAWGAYINAAKDDMVAVADLPYAKAYVQHSIVLDPDYYHAAGYTFMGLVTASEMAADLDAAKAYFDKALGITERRALLIQVNMARYYAVQAGDRALFDELIAEVLDAGDVLPEARLSNRMARERAELYTAYADQLF